MTRTVLLSYVAQALDGVRPIGGRVFDALGSPTSSVPGSVGARGWGGVRGDDRPESRGCPPRIGLPLIIGSCKNEAGIGCLSS